MYWYSYGVVQLNSPSLQDCVDVISQLITQMSNIKHDRVYLQYSFPDSTLLFLSQMYLTGVKELRISHTPINEEHMYCITHCLLNNQLKHLHLYNTKLTSNVLSILANATNTSLKTLEIAAEEITEYDVNCIGEILMVDKALQRLELWNCGITDNGIRSLSNCLLKNNTLVELNLCHNPFTSAGIQYLFCLLTTNNTIKRLVIDRELYKSSSEQLKEYTHIKHRLVFE